MFTLYTKENPQWKETIRSKIHTESYFFSPPTLNKFYIFNTTSQAFSNEFIAEL